jgi:acetolactate synthase-1/2/3 large subunit
MRSGSIPPFVPDPGTTAPGVGAARAPTAAAALLRAFAQHGVRAAFGIPGGTVSPVFDALHDTPEIDYLPTRHEAVAGFAAMGHARATGLPALVLTTSGPGITNAMTGIAAASLEELPMIVVSGEVPSAARARAALQDGSPSGLDVHAALHSVTRWSGSVLSGAGVAGIAERAWTMANGTRPGPVFLTIPLDVGGAAASGSVSPALTQPPPSPNSAVCARAALVLAASLRPLLVVGNGARKASAELVALAAALEMRVAATAHGKGIFPESHPLYLGVVGAGQHPSVSAFLAERPPDVTLVVGSRLGDLATNGWTVPLAGSHATIQIDRDPWLIGRNAPVDIGIVGDARASVNAITAALPRRASLRLVRPPRSRFGPGDGCRSFREELAESDAVPLKPQRVLRALSLAFPDAVWCVDVGEHLTMAQHYLRIDAPDRYHSMIGLGSMGSGLGVAIGVKLARPASTVIGLCGDGGFAMHAGEILTCAERRIGVVYAVFNDGCWNMVEHGMQTVYGRAPVPLARHTADIAAAARAFGGLGVRIEAPEHLTRSFLYSAIMRADGLPLVLDIRIDPTESLTADTRSAALKHFANK